MSLSSVLLLALAHSIGGTLAQSFDAHKAEISYGLGELSSGKVTPYSSYPQCAQDCLRSVSAGYPANCPNQPNLGCECSSTSRSNVSSCYVLTCSDVDYSNAENLDANRCNPVYSGSSSSQIAVASAISSATIAAQAALATIDPAKVEDLPTCAQHCVPVGLAAGGCNGGADPECACRCPAVQNSIGPCYLSSCGFEDLQVLSFVAKSRCGPVGGQEPKMESACGLLGNGTAASSNPANATTVRTTDASVATLNPTSVPFAGVAVSPRSRAIELLGAASLTMIVVYS